MRISMSTTTLITTSDLAFAAAFFSVIVSYLYVLYLAIV